ncbi:hypothetical protein V6N13_110227 [Hibiscus sabdariffa]
MEPILPPAIRRPPGRPTKKMRKEADEVNNPKLSKRGQQSKCSKCGMSGHNKRTYRGQVGANQPVKRPTPSSHGPANHHPPSNNNLHHPNSNLYHPNSNNLKGRNYQQGDNLLLHQLNSIICLQVNNQMFPTLQIKNLKL